LKQGQVETVAIFHALKHVECRAFDGSSTG